MTVSAHCLWLTVFPWGLSIGDWLPACRHIPPPRFPGLDCIKEFITYFQTYMLEFSLHLFWDHWDSDWFRHLTERNRVLTMALNVAPVRDTKWLTLEVCRQYQRGTCSRSDEECKFAHPPKSCQVENGRVIACFDSLKVRWSIYMSLPGPVGLSKRALWALSAVFTIQIGSVFFVVATGRFVFWFGFIFIETYLYQAYKFLFLYLCLN